MTELDRYLDAATRQNTVRSYASALRHFEVEWQGHLPATPDSVARYLAAYAQTLATSTLRQRLAAIASWHRDHGFVDPTRSPLVRKVLKGIQTLHPGQVKQAAPLQIRRLVELDDWLAAAIAAAHAGAMGRRRCAINETERWCCSGSGGDSVAMNCCVWTWPISRWCRDGDDLLLATQQG